MSTGEHIANIGDPSNQLVELTEWESFLRDCADTDNAVFDAERALEINKPVI